MSLQSSKISLYIHIPFCTKKCSYCDFYSEVNMLDQSSNVIDQIIFHGNIKLKELGFPKIETVFIGGGTPSILNSKDLHKLLTFVKKVAPNAIETTIESNPESINMEFIKTIKKFNITRLSIGVQSFTDELIKTIGRNCTLENVYNALDIVKKYWDRDFNIDLICAIPGQTLQMVENDILEAVKYKPEHISFYNLMLEEGTVLEDKVSRGLLEEMDQDESFTIWQSGRQILKQNGYYDYEVSNFCKSRPSLHNLAYWELKPYLGIGPGGVSTYINNKGKIVRVSNEKSLKSYIKDKNWGESIDYINNTDFLSDYIMMGLRLRKGIDLVRFKSIFNIDIFKLIPGINKLIDMDKLEVRNNYLALTETGFNIMNSIIIEIFELIEKLEIEKINWFY